MSRNNKVQNFAGVGVSTLIIIFVVLAITVFLLFTLFTVRQDIKSAQKNAQNHKAYYSADVAVTEKLAKLEAMINGKASASASYEELGFSIRGTSDGDYAFILKQEIDENSSILCIAVLKNNRLKIISYEIINNNSYVVEESLPVWDGSVIPTP